MDKNLKYPTAQDFLINLPLYKVVHFEDADLEYGRKVYYFDEKIDSYCPECNSHSIFSRYWGYSKSIKYTAESWVNEGRFVIELQCSRNSKHMLFFLFNAVGQSIEKIGQKPSMADLNLYDVQKYSKVLEKKYFQELTKAVGLAAHGVGVGSFVYLRRIFEFLIDEAHSEVKQESDWDESLYSNARMSERIGLLSSKLPEFLVTNKSLYSILSKGIHELSDEECLTAFPIVKVGIEIVLDDKIEKINRDKKLAEARKTIADFSRKI